MNILGLTAILSLMGSPEMPNQRGFQNIALPMECRVTEAPKINVRPLTADIIYDKTKTAAELSKLKSNTISPYGLGTDQITGGLRHDQPTIETAVRFKILQDPTTQSVCLTYDTINVDIKLQPKIYIAREFNTGRCGFKVLEHEKKHVHVDRKVISKYSKLMGKAIQNAVNQAGAIGPFPSARTEELQTMMQTNISNALNSVMLSLTNEMNLLQQQVDSKEEYDHVGSYCERNSKRAFKNQKRLNRFK